MDISRKLAEVETVVFWDCEEASLPLLADCYKCRSRRQAPGDLGQRMQAAFETMFSDGFDSCCIIGSDIPDLPLACIQQAFALLAAGQTDAVFGPSADGGYYLLGLRGMIPQLFANINWSTPLVLRQSQEAAQEIGITTALLPICHDIDTQEDLNSFMTRSAMLLTTHTRAATLATVL